MRTASIPQKSAKKSKTEPNSKLAEAIKKARKATDMSTTAVAKVSRNGLHWILMIEIL